MTSHPSLKASLSKQSEQFKSCLYTGTVLHRRQKPKTHQFQYKLFMTLIDLDEIEQLFRVPGIWSTSRWSLACFDRQNYLGDSSKPLKQALCDFVRTKTGREITGPVRLLTHLKYFGFSFNPVSFYYCYNQHEELQMVIAEVTNTPWGERHHYFIPWDDEDGEEKIHTCSKDFHVSPFLPMNLTYQWNLGVPKEHLSVELEDHDDLGCLFEASLKLNRLPITKWNLAVMLARFPLLTMRIVIAIYWQATCLWWKKIPFYPHPKTL